MAKAMAGCLADVGMLQPVVADHGGEIVSKELWDPCHEHHTLVCCTVPCGLWECMMTEQEHRSLKPVLPALCVGGPLSWLQCLPNCEAVKDHAVMAAQVGWKAKPYHGQEKWLALPSNVVGKVKRQMNHCIPLQDCAGSLDVIEVQVKSVGQNKRSGKPMNLALPPRK